MEEDCLFCKIIKNKVPSSIVYEDEFVLAFKDIHPVAPIHILFIPKIHISNINEITIENSLYIAKIYESIKKVAIEYNISEKGYRVICNCGEDGGQVINHIHFHLLAGKKLGVKIVS